jgi:hypothetical protein
MTRMTRIVADQAALLSATIRVIRGIRVIRVTSSAYVRFPTASARHQTMSSSYSSSSKL